MTYNERYHSNEAFREHVKAQRRRRYRENIEAERESARVRMAEKLKDPTFRERQNARRRTGVTQAVRVVRPKPKRVVPPKPQPIPTCLWDAHPNSAIARLAKKLGRRPTMADLAVRP